LELFGREKIKIKSYHRRTAHGRKTPLLTDGGLPPPEKFVCRPSRPLFFLKKTHFKLAPFFFNLILVKKENTHPDFISAERKRKIPNPTHPSSLAAPLLILSPSPNCSTHTASH
jgi:hypothetical protein